MGDLAESDLLVDSHMLLWLNQEPHRISARQMSALVDPQRTVYVSAASAWELGIKYSKGKLEFAGTVSGILLRFRLTELPVTIAHAEQAALLPMLHKDSFDRLLVAQAMLEGLTLVTVDPMMARCGAAVLV